jgi:hypothetical protein
MENNSLLGVYGTTSHDAASRPNNPRPPPPRAARQAREADVNVISLSSSSNNQASGSWYSTPAGSQEACAEHAIVYDPDYSQHAKSAIEVTAIPVNADQTTWTPIWLSRRSLLGFAALFVSLAASLIVLWILNNVYHGFPLVLSTYHYAWTYGPTAVLICVIALWRQVDYHCKLMQPWQELDKGQVGAERSILLDYLSPVLIISFLHAVRRRHVPVAASVAGFIMLKIIILLSTGLLILTPVHLTGPQPVIIQTIFNAESFWDTVPDSTYYLEPGPTPNGAYLNISSQPVYEYLRSLEKQDAESVTDLVDNMVYQSFTPTSGSLLRDVSVEVDVFRPDISCEIANVTTFELNGYLAAQLDSATCSVGAADQVNPSNSLDIDTTKHNVSDACGADCSSWLTPHFWMVNCSKPDTVDNTDTQMFIDAETSWDLRFALLVVNFTLGPPVTLPLPSSNSFALLPNPELHQTAAVICNVDYSMHKSTILEDPTNGTFSVGSLSPMEKIHNLTGTMLGQMLYTSLVNFKELYDAEVPFYELLLSTLEGRKTMNRLLAVETLQTSAVQVWAGLSAHFVRENFLTPTSIPETATGIRIEDRLIVGRVSLWLMVMGFIFLAVVALCIVLTVHRGVVPQDIGRLSTDASILAASWRLRDLLMNSGHLRTSKLTDLLHGYNFATTFQDRFHIQVTDKRMLAQRRKSKIKSETWKPSPVKYHNIFLTMAVPLGAIVVLEVLYQISKARAGLIDVSGSEEVASYASRYISAAILLLVATCFSGLDFVVALFLPYSRLRSGPLPARGGMELHTLGKIPLQALWLSLRHRDAGSFFAKLAAIIGSILTIVSSGLWTIDRGIVVHQDIEASLANTWELEWFNSSSTGDGGAAVLFDDIQHGGAVVPASIWDNIILPDVADIRLVSEGSIALDPNQTREQNYTLQLGGLRPYLSCEVIADEHITVYNRLNGQDVSPQDIKVTARPPLPLACQHAGPGGNESSYDFSVQMQSHKQVRDSLFLGAFLDLHLGPWKESSLGLADSSGEYPANVEAQLDNPAGCPSIGAFFIKAVNKTVQKENVTALLCSQMIQQVRVNVTYTGLDLNNPTVSLHKGPVLIDGSATNLTNGTDGIDTFPYRVQTYLGTLYGKANLTSIEHDDPVIPEDIDSFIEHMIWGPNGTAADALAGRENRHVFKEAVQALYARYMRLVIDMRFRQPIARDENSDGSVVSDVVVKGTSESFTSRLQLDRASKLALQIMLGAMTLFGTLAFMMTDLRGTLPRKPTSIASRMALLAGSDLCREHAEKHLSDPAAEGWLFSLGWWRVSDPHDISIQRATSEEDAAPAKEDEASQGKRFGIDIGVPEQFGYRETKWWTLRRRLGTRVSKGEE